jgi:serine/threonine protein kinase
MIGLIVDYKFQIEKLLSGGMFGENLANMDPDDEIDPLSMFSGVNIKTGEVVLVKIELKTQEESVLEKERIILEYLSLCNITNIQRNYWFGNIETENDNWQMICSVLSFSSFSLTDYFRHKGPIATPPLNILMKKCLNILQHIHSHFVVHQKIEPDNFKIQAGEIYLYDFENAQLYIDEEQGHHNTMNQILNEHIFGNPQFCSYFHHCGYSGSRRDDFVSIGYIYLWLHCGELPWMTTTVENAESSIFATLKRNHIQHPANLVRRLNKQWNYVEAFGKKMMEKKTTLENQKSGGGENNNIGILTALKFLKYAYSLQYDQNPNYDWILALFH